MPNNSSKPNKPNKTEKIKVLIVDDSAFNRQTLKQILIAESDIEVVGVATNGMDAMGKVMRLKPDVITLDFEMPEMDGLTFLRWVMSESPTRVLMVSSYSDKNLVFKALEFGAMDFIVKPTSRASVELKNIARDLIEKVRGVRAMNVNTMKKNLKKQEIKAEESKKEKAYSTDISVVAIGTSTGGPAALQMILTELPADMPCGIVISQHMPRGFTAPLADRLNGICSINVREASHGDYVRSGEALICPGGYHMSFSSYGNEVKVTLEEAPEDDKYVPSVDHMFLSVNKEFPKKVVALILTGMGNDGMEGMKEIDASGGLTIAESEDTAIVFGMPKEAINAGAVKKVLPLDMMSSELRRTVLGERRR
jgi:two-component system chemotaxis response regulator CheB